MSQTILRDAAIAIVRQALDRAEDFVHVCDRNNDGIKLLACSEEIQRLHSALATPDADQAPEPTESQMDAAIAAYDAAWNPVNLGRENKEDALLAAFKAFDAARPAPVGAVPAPDVSDWAVIAHDFLKWNRSLDKPVVEISKELYVARKVLALAAAPAAPIVDGLSKLQQWEWGYSGMDQATVQDDELRYYCVADVNALFRPAAEHAKPEPVVLANFGPNGAAHWSSPSEPVEQVKQAEGVMSWQDRMAEHYAKGSVQCHPTSHFMALEISDWRGQQAGAVDGELGADDVEWVTNDNAELGVKIGNQFFFLYKGSSLVYKDGLHDNGTPMYWRPVFKREFGECAHPINHADYTRIGTVSLSDSDEWQVLPAASANQGGE